MLEVSWCVNFTSLCVSVIDEDRKEREREKNPTNSVWLYFDLCVSLCPLGYRVHVNAGDEGTSLLHLFKWKVLRLIKKNPHITPEFFPRQPGSKSACGQVSIVVVLEECT